MRYVCRKYKTELAFLFKSSLQCWLLVCGVCLAVLGAKFQLINTYGSQVPFVDQWGGEAMKLYRPWLQHHFYWGDLFASHNEHRIVFTRLLDLFILTLNHQWNSRVLMTVNAIIPVLFCGLLIRAAAAYISQLSACLLAVLITLFYSSNVTYGNTLWAFQSAFYFCILFSILHIGLTFLARPLGWKWWLGQAIGLANLFTNAGGVLSSLAILVFTIWCCIRWRGSIKDYASTMLANAAIAWIGIFLAKNETGNDVVRHIYRPNTIAEMGTMVGNMFAWPFSAMQDSQMWVVVFAPILVFFIRLTFKKTRDREGAILASLAIMVILQNLVFAIFRGVAWSRYLDNLSLGIIVNLACLLYWRVSNRLKVAKWILTLVWCVFVCEALFAQQKDFDKRAFSTLKSEKQLDLITVRKVVRGEKVDLDSAAAGIGLRGVLEVVGDPFIRPILPVCLREPLSLESLDGGDFLKRSVPPEEFPLSPWPGFTVYSKRHGLSVAGYSSQIRDCTSYAIVFLVKGDLASAKDSLCLTSMSGQVIRAFISRPTMDPQWIEMVFRLPREAFSVTASSRSQQVFEFSEPVEMPRMTYYTDVILPYGRTFWIVGWFAIFSSCIMGLISLWIVKSNSC